jgi:FADH2 O2-dependent halogenase
MPGNAFSYFLLPHSLKHHQENFMLSSSSADFQVGIIGGGPAGATTAAYLAKAGLSCVVFERELFPRPHVGESLVPSSTRVFKELDFLDQMEEAKFPHKVGAVWTASMNSRTYQHDWSDLPNEYFADIRFDERKMEGVDKEYTYHVDRGKFDLMLLQHAKNLGATVYEGVKVRRVDFDNDPKPRIHFYMGAKEMSVNVDMVVDASGRNTFLGNQLKLKVIDPVFNQVAYHTWFEGYDRGGSDIADYIAVHFLPMKNSWIWQIPITKTTTSIGIVTQRQNFPNIKEEREDWFWKYIQTRPDLYEKLQKAERIRPFKEEGDYSYSMKQICGDRFVLLGDAARFVDPIFSSGVSIALNSARIASSDILAAAQKGDFSQEQFKIFEHTMRCGTRNWYDFITLYYRLNVLFTQFVNDPMYRLDVLKLLQGDVYDEETPEVLRKMKEIVTKVEQDKNHVWHKLLGNLTDKAFQPTF